MTHIVFATCLEQPDLQPSDRIVAAALSAAGGSVVAAPWNGPFDPFEAADLVVVRSTWDYASASQAFLRWLVRLDALPNVVNAPALMKWNLSKRYMARLREQGAPIVPTRFCAPHGPDLAAAMDDLGLAEAVVKPVIGAGGSGLSIIRRSDEHGIFQAAAKLGASAMVQPKLAEINDPGETSFIFVDGAFSHAILKTPKAEEILCQSEHGGVSVRVEPSPARVEAAKAILDHLPTEPLYARVDAISTKEDLMVMEVELIEPELFYDLAPEKAALFAEALLARARN